MDIFSILELFGGLAMFLYGMRLMGDSLKESSSGTLKSVMEKMTNNAFKGFILGLFVTALIQSSTATIVITSGLVTAGIITTRQSLGIIMGANLGTTVTGQIIRLMDIESSSSTSSILQFFKPSTLAPIALILGIVFIMFFKFNNSRLAGNISMGFGILFTGLMTMTNSVNVLRSSDIMGTIFSSLGDNVILGFIAGTAVAFVLQSASAAIGILQSFSMTGMFTFASAIPIVLGVFLGAGITTYIVCALGAKSDAKRVGMQNLIYNISKILIIAVGLSLARAIGLLPELWTSTVNPGAIADSNTIFNLACAVILLPCCGLIEKVSDKIIKPEEVSTGKYDDKLMALDPVFFSTPALAFSSCYDALLTMFDAAVDNIRKSMDLLRQYDEKTFLEIKSEEGHIDLFADRISNYLVQLSGHLHEDYHVKIMDEYYKVVGEFERLGDHAQNISEEAKELFDKNSHLTDYALKELSVTQDILENILAYTRLAFEKRDDTAARHIEPLEEVVDDLVYVMKENHMGRLRTGKCSVTVDNNFLNILNNIERISDVCSNVGIAVVARVEPELAAEAHTYISRLHQGKDDSFNEEYHNAHDMYFAKLGEIVGM